VQRRTSPGRSIDRTCVPSRDEQGCNCAGRISQSLSGADPTDCRRTLASPDAAGAHGGSGGRSQLRCIIRPQQNRRSRHRPGNEIRSRRRLPVTRERCHDHLRHDPTQ
jgi:hypothetical protein